MSLINKLSMRSHTIGETKECQQGRWASKGWVVLALKGGGLWNPISMEEENECQRWRWILKRVDCEISNQLEKRTRNWILKGVDCEISNQLGKRTRNECERGRWILKLGGLWDPTSVGKREQERVSARTLDLEGEWTVRSHINWRGNGCQCCEDAWPKGRWIMRSHIGWGGEWNERERGTSASEDAGPWRRVDCEIPHWLEKRTMNECQRRKDVGPRGGWITKISHWLGRRLKQKRTRNECQWRCWTLKGSGLWDPASIGKENEERVPASRRRWA